MAVHAREEKAVRLLPRERAFVIAARILDRDRADLERIHLERNRRVRSGRARARLALGFIDRDARFGDHLVSELCIAAGETGVDEQHAFRRGVDRRMREREVIAREPHLQHGFVRRCLFKRCKIRGGLLSQDESLVGEVERRKVLHEERAADAAIDARAEHLAERRERQRAPRNVLQRPSADGHAVDAIERGLRGFAAGKRAYFGRIRRDFQFVGNVGIDCDFRAAGVDKHLEFFAVDREGDDGQRIDDDHGDARLVWPGELVGFASPIC